MVTAQSERAMLPHSGDENVASFKPDPPSVGGGASMPDNQGMGTQKHQLLVVMGDQPGTT